MRTSRKKSLLANPTFLRWITVIGYALVGAWLAVPLAQLIHSIVESAFANTAGQFPVFALIIRVTTIIAALLVCFLQAGFCWRHFNQLFRWPPATVAIPIGIWMLSVGIGVTEPDQWGAAGGWHVFENPLLLSGIGTTATVLGLWVWAKFKSVPPKAGSSKNARKPSICTVEDLERLPIDVLLELLANEAPVEDDGSDLFGARVRGTRVFEGLQQKRTNLEGKDLYKTAVIQGPFGAGKSTVVHFLKNAAKQTSGCQYIFAHVNCWGFSSAAAQEHILDQALAELSKHADCLSLRRMPSAYADAITDSSSWLAAIAGVFVPSDSPVDLLQRLTPILHAIDAHLVIIIEDTDRNGSDFDQKQIEAMLYSFRQVERVSFVLTAGRKCEIEFPKIAEQIEYIPSITDSAAIALLDKIREHCRNHWFYIDPVSGWSRPDRLIHIHKDSGKIAGRGLPSWIFDVARLLDNPRSLKRVLSSIVDAWSRLHGEVDLDELIIVTCLREVAPTAFDYLATFRTSFNAVKPSSDRAVEAQDERKMQRIAYLKERWLHAASQSEHDAQTLGRLIGELVYSSTHITGCEVNKAQRLQSIADSKGEVSDIYWGRLTSLALMENEPKDQEVLLAMKNAKDGDVRLLVEGMSASSGFGDLVLRLQKWNYPLNSPIILRLVSGGLRKMHPIEFGIHGHRPKRYENVISLLMDELKGRDDDFPVDWLEDEMVACLPYHLREADELFEDFRRNLMNPAAFERVRHTFNKRLRFACKHLVASEFAKCFPSNYPWLLAHLVKLNGSQNPQTCLTGWEHWKWMKSALLEALSEQPEIIVPQIICAFGQSNARGDRPTRFDFDESSLKLVFGKRSKEVLSKIAAPPPFADAVTQWMPGVTQLAAKEAQRLLREGWSPKKADAVG